MCKYGQNWVLHGVTSWGKGYECGAPKNPGVYTRISRYIKWMKKIMSSKFSRLSYDTYTYLLHLSPSSPVGHKATTMVFHRVLSFTAA